MGIGSIAVPGGLLTPAARGLSLRDNAGAEVLLGQPETKRWYGDEAEGRVFHTWELQLVDVGLVGQLPEKLWFSFLTPDDFISGMEAHVAFFAEALGFVQINVEQYSLTGTDPRDHAADATDGLLLDYSTGVTAYDVMVYAIPLTAAFAVGKFFQLAVSREFNAIDAVEAPVSLLGVEFRYTN